MASEYFFSISLIETCGVEKSKLTAPTTLSVPIFISGAPVAINPVIKSSLFMVSSSKRAKFTVALYFLTALSSKIFYSCSAVFQLDIAGAKNPNLATILIINHLDY